MKGYRPGLIAAVVKLAFKYLSLLAPDLGITQQDIYDMIGQFSDQLSNGEFGLFKGKNATKDGSYYTINNGRYDHHKFNHYEKGRI